ncbi:MAG: hypothetical protein IT578_06780 [Verrucomicrobiae bacterium]|nr:hypothetical protein [Verrucomicrobiae bacterium]
MIVRLLPILLVAGCALPLAGCGQHRPAPSSASRSQPSGAERMNVVTTQGRAERLAFPVEEEGASKDAREGAAPSLLAVKAASAPKLDGVLEEVCWRHAKPTKDFQRVSGLPDEAAKWVVVRAAYDAEALYVGATLSKPGPGLTATVKAAGGRVWMDDALEIFFLHPEHRVPCQVDVNALGTVYAGASAPGTEWKPSVTAAATIGEKAWTVEVRIPWSDLGVKEPGGAPISIQFRYLVNGQSGSASWASGDVADPEGWLVFRAGDVPPRAAAPRASAAKLPSEKRAGAPEKGLRIALDREQAWFGDRAATGVLEVGADLAAAQGELTLQFWDRNHVLAEKKMAPAVAGRHGFALGLENLSSGNYRVVADFRSAAGRAEAAAELDLREGAPRPERRQVRLLTNWPEGFPGDLAAPLYAAVAFPGGVLLDPEHVRVVDGKGREVSCQHEVLARWGPEGSIRWLALYFPGQRSESYSVEFGAKVRRQVSKGPAVAVREGGESLEVDTGVARFELPKKGPLLGKAWRGGQAVLAGGAPCLLLADQEGAIADETRAEAGEAPVVEVAGPLVTIVRREGFYRKKNGARLGKYIVRLKFFAGSSTVAIQHTFVATEDSNKVQYSDLAFRVKPAFGGPWKAVFDDRPVHDAVAWEGTLDPAAEDGAYLFQAVNRHHGQSTARFEIGQRKGRGAWEKAREGEVAGEWGAISSGGAGVAVTLPNFAKLFPKEIEAGPEGLTAHLWSSRGGRKLDYRVATVIEYLGRDWVEKACRKGLKPYQGGFDAIKGLYTNAAGTSRTHDLALRLFGGATEEAAREAMLADQPPLAVQDPAWLTETDAVGPLAPFDPKANPRQEAYVRNYVREFLVEVQDRFDLGFLDYGSGPHTYAGQADTDPRSSGSLALFYRYSHMDYGFRTAIWWLYARSGDRMYRDYGVALNRHIGDFHFSRWETPERPLGAMLGGGHSEETPFYWSGNGGREKWGGLSGHQGVELNNHLYDWYLTGDRAAMDGVKAFGETFARLCDPAVLPNIGSSSDESVPQLFAAELYRATWDPRFGRLLAECRDRLLDLRTSNGLANRDYCGNYAKVSTHLMPVVRDWEATGSHLAARALEKACRQEILGNGPRNHGAPEAGMGYHDFSGLFAWAGLRLTGDARYAGWIQERIGRTVCRYSDTEGKIRWFPGREAPYDGPWAPAFLGSIAYGLGVVAEAPKPLAAFPAVTTDGDVWFVKEADLEARVFMEFHHGWDLALEHVPKMPAYRARDNDVGPVHLDLFPNYFARERNGLASGNGSLTVPREAIPGEYRLIGAKALATTAAQIVSAAPEGTFLRAESLPPRRWFFQVPKGKKGAIYATGPIALNDGGSRRAIPAGVWVDLEGGRQDRLIQITAERNVFVRFKGDLPPVFAENSAERFFLPKNAPPAAPIGELEKPEALYVPGFTGIAGDQALLFNGTRALTLPFGERREDESWTRFSQTRGTLEFWFKPQWTSRLEVKERTIRFLAEGMWGLAYRLEPGGVNKLEFTVPVAKNLKGHTHLARVPVEFEQGRWYHLALCWDTLPERGWIGEMYLDGQGYGDGKAVGLGRFAEGEHAKFFTTPWLAAALNRPVSFPGEFDAVVDEVRVSDIPRYPTPFEPIRRAPFEADGHTTILLHLDGTTASAAAPSGAPPGEAVLTP